METRANHLWVGGVTIVLLIALAAAIVWIARLGQGAQNEYDILYKQSVSGLATGSQVSFAFEDGYAAMQALIAHGVIGDFRAPNIMRFGFTPLYIDEGDVTAAVTILARVIHERLWDRPEFLTKSRVT